MPCVNDHPDFLRMAANWADPLIADLLQEDGMLINPQVAIMAEHQHHEHHHNGPHHGHHEHQHNGHHHH